MHYENLFSDKLKDRLFFKEDASASIVQKLGSGNDPATRRALENVTLVAMPMVNPDGGELNRRANAVAWDDVVADFPQLAGAPRAWYHSLTGDGIAQPIVNVTLTFPAPTPKVTIQSGSR